MPVARLLRRLLRAIKRHVLADVALIAAAVWFTSGALFSLVEGVGFFDGLYWALVTMTTVGYGDIVPHTLYGRVIAMLTIISGIAVYTATISLAAGSLIEAAERRRQGYIRYRGVRHVVVVGWTPASEAAIRELRNRGYTGDIVLVTEKPATVLREAELEGVTLVRGDPTRRDTLLRANVPRANMVIVSTNDDAKTVLVVLAVRGLNGRARIVAEALHPENVELMHKAGADIVVPTRDLGGRMLATSLIEPGAAMFVENISRAEARPIELHEMPAAPYAGRRYIDVLLEMRKKGLTPVALRRRGVLISNPSDDMVIEPDDILVVVMPGGASQQPAAAAMEPGAAAGGELAAQAASSATRGEG
jgi:voltage-gated potassium channel